jgi:hypothetical protein
LRKISARKRPLGIWLGCVSSPDRRHPDQGTPLATAGGSGCAAFTLRLSADKLQ